MPAIPTTRLPSGAGIPTFGLGTWRMGEDARRRADEVTALRHGLDLGVPLIDTAEMYGDGEAERSSPRRSARAATTCSSSARCCRSIRSRRGTVAACERSLKRLKTDRIDLYLLHWRGSVPLEDTVEAFKELVEAEKIVHWGVSNFDIADMGELWKTPEGKAVATNQVLYNLTRRGIEFDLMPWCRQHGMPIMAYSPIEQGRHARPRRACARWRAATARRRRRSRSPG